MNINKETMKKVLDLTKCNSTEEICDVLEKKLITNEKQMLILKKSVNIWLQNIRKKQQLNLRRKVLLSVLFIG